jgi:hypothetical protein
MDTEITLDGYTKGEIFFNILWMNIFAIIVFIIFSILFGCAFYIIWHEKFNLGNINVVEELTSSERMVLTLNNIVVLFIPTFIGMVLHELIHGLFYALFAKNRFKSIKFGIKLKYGIAYCICTELIKIKHSIIVALMPVIILGFIPAVFSLFVGSLFWLLIGIIFIMAGAGDFLLILQLLKENKEDYVLDTLGEINSINIYRKIKE